MDKNITAAIPATLITTRTVITECTYEYTYFNIVSFILIALYGIYTLIKLRKRLSLHYKIMGAIMIILLLFRLSMYLYL